LIVSIIRVGLAETKKFAEGYEAIFGKAKKDEGAEDQAQQPARKPAAQAAAKPKKKAKRK
jgi:hypothetical protein